MNISAAIRNYLRSHGIKQTFLAEKCGWTRQMANTIVCGKRKITADEYAAICDALGLPYDLFYKEASQASTQETPAGEAAGTVVSRYCISS